MKILSAPFGLGIILLFAGCNNKVIPLKGVYQDKPFEFTASAPKEDIWNKLIDVFTAKGLAIKTIDKNSGIITTDNTSFLNSYTYENKDGSLATPDAMVVCSKVRGTLTLSSSIKPDVITGQWAVRVKEDGNKTIVDTKLANAVGKVIIQNPLVNGQTVAETHDLIVKSTGIFEKTIEEALK